MDFQKLYVKKRRGRTELVDYNKITARIKRLCWGLNMEFIDIANIVRKVIDGLYSGVTTWELDNLAAETCAVMSTVHPDYGTLAARIYVSNLHKETDKEFSAVVEKLHKNVHRKKKCPMPLVSEEFYENVMFNKEALDSAIIYDRDFSFTYFGLKTLEKAYLLRSGGKIVERPQHLIMRVAVALHGKNLERVIETYEAMSRRYFIHATPTLFNAGIKREGLSSCFLLTATAEDDSIENIYKLLGECAVISKYSGGIGISMHDIRARDSLIMSTNGKSEGIVPLLKVFDKSAQYVTQSNKRPGSIAVFLEPWHAEIQDFIKLKINHGKEEERAKSLFYGLWIPDLFMEKARKGEDWCLFCPNEAPGLSKVYGREFEDLYHHYEKQGMYREKVPAQKLMQDIIECQIRTGVPYICYKDAANRKNNQKHVGTLRGSNLCVAPETMILTSEGYYPIASLEDQAVKVWNGTQFSETVVRKTNDDAELLRVTFSNGVSLECTPYHKFYVQDDYNENKVLTKEAKELVPSQDKLIKVDFPVIQNGGSQESFERPYTAGFLSGDCTYSIFSVPLNHDLCTKLRFFEGLCDAEGAIVKNDSEDWELDMESSLQIRSNKLSFLREVMLMLQTLGVDPRIVLDCEKQMSFMGRKSYESQKTYRLLLPHAQVNALQKLGFSPKRLLLLDTTSNKETERKEIRRFVKVTEIEYTGRRDKTYCFNEPLEHRGIFNGVVTSQCVEVMQYTSHTETAVCNLGSLCLPSFVEKKKNNQSPEFDFQMLYEMTKIVTRNLDRVIDVTHYPVEKARYSNMRHRPMGIGVSGLADTFTLMRLPFDSAGARELNLKIFETIAFGAYTASCELAKELGPYETYEGSEFSKGKFQWNLWEDETGQKIQHSGMWDWEGLREKMLKYGMRNSLLTSTMPTASTSQIMGVAEAFEPLGSNFYKRITLSGEFPVINQHLIDDLCKRNLWNEDIKDKIVENEGSIQNIKEIPEDIRQLYKITWDLSQKVIIDMAAERGPYIDQSQSMNVFIAKPTHPAMTSLHFYAWSKGLKTGMYYLRALPPTKPVQITLQRKRRTSPITKETTGKKTAEVKVKTSIEGNMTDDEDDAVMACTRDQSGNCLSCSA